MSITDEELEIWGTRRQRLNVYAAIVHKKFLGIFKTRKQAHECAIAYAKEHNIMPYTRNGNPHNVGPAFKRPEFRLALLRKIYGDEYK